MNALVRSPLHGEVLGPGETVEVVAALNPMKLDSIRVRVPSGSSIAEVVAFCSAEGKVSRLAAGAHVSVNGETISKEAWDGHRVVAGDVVVVRAVAGKGVGSLLRTILSLALIVFASFIVGPSVLGIAGTILGTVVSAAIVFGGNLALNSLFPPTDTRANDDRKQLYSIASRQNLAARWQPIPVLLGEHRIAPKYASSPYSEFFGDDQYLRMLFVWGQGPLDITDIKIGETSIDDFDDVEIQTFSGYANDGQQTLYPSEMVQTDFNIETSSVDGPVTRLSGAEADEIVVDMVAPQGIIEVYTSDGSRHTYTVRGTIELLEPNTEIVVDSQEWIFKDKTQNVIRRSYRFSNLAGGPYDVRVTRITQDDPDDPGKAETVLWTALKTFRKSPPIEYGKPLAITALRIKATKQLNGVITDLTAKVTSKARSWNGTAWVADTPTRVPADLFRLVLQGPGIARPRTDAQIDLPALERWADKCRQAGWTFDMYRDFKASVRDTLKDICAAGRAVPVFLDGKFSVAMEDTLSPIVQAFTPRNSRNFSVVYSYRELPHGLRVKFVNRDKDWSEDETLVFDDGYSKETATLFEQVEFPGVTDPELIFRHARYRIAEAKLRTRVLSFTTDLEHLVCTRGDRLRIAYDVVRIGLAQGRVLAVDGNELTVDEPAVMEAGKSYGMRVRNANGVERLLTIATVSGEHQTVSFTGVAPAVGDTFMFGLAGQETQIFRLLSIRPGKDFSAELQVVDDAPGITSADTGPIADPGTSVTVDPPLSLFRPFNLLVAQSLEDRNGVVVQATKVYWSVRAGGPRMDRTLVVAQATIEGAVQEQRVTVAGDVFFAEFINLPSADWTFRAQSFTVDGRWTGFSDAVTLDQILPADEIGVGLDQLQQEARAILDGLRDDLDAAVVEAGELATELEGQADALAAEAQARAAEAAALAQQIAAEVQARIAGVSANTDAIAAEAQARADALVALAAEDADLANALAAEASTRASAVTALAGADAALAQDIAAESVARAGDIADEAQARIDAIGAQATALNEEAAQRLVEIRIQAVSLRALADRLLDIDAVLAESAALGLDQVREVRTRIDVTRDAITAAYTQAITVATGPTSALAQQVESLEVGIEDEASSRTAEITRLDQAIVTGDAAQASAREILSTQIRGSYAGSDVALAGGMLGSLRSTFASQYEAITESLVSLEAGVDEQFDFLRFWPFDDDADGWIGNGTPTWVTGGWLRPANHASDPNVVSVDSLGIDADRYGQVRARIRRTGAPVWEGRLYWNTVVGSAWSGGRSVTVAEPTFSENGTAVISFNTGATGVIERLRLDLSAAQTATDYFEIDWVAIGRPSPGASIASQEELRQTVVNGLASEATAREQLSSRLTGLADPTGVDLASLSSGLLYEERAARTTADTALSESVLGLESSISNASGQIAATASALQSITTRVSSAESTIGTQGTAIVSNTEALTALSGQLAGKADTSAIDQLSQEIALLGGDGLQSQATSIRSLSARLQDLELDLAEQEALGLAGDTATREAVATAYQQLDAYTRRVEGRVETEARRIDGLQVTLAGKVDASALNSLTVRVLQQGNTITTTTASVTALASTVAGKADVSALGSLSTTVTQQGATLSTQAQAISALQGSLDGKADSSALNTLSQTVTQQGDDITANADAITALSGSIAGKASAAALNSLATTVTQQGEDIAVNTSAITSLEGSIAGKADASAVNDLTVLVSAQGDDIDSLVTSVTALETALPGKADASAVSALQTTVSQQGTTIATNSTAITSLQGAVAGKADASALSSLSQTVTQQGDDIAANSSSITALGSAIAGKADASAVSTLQTTVTEQGEDITSNSAAITSLQGEVAGKASTAAVDALSQEITLLGGEGLQSQASAIRSVSAQLLDLEMGLAEQGALGIAGDTATRQAIATASQQLDAYTRQVEGRTEVNAAAITALQASLPGKADVTLVNEARTSVIQQGVLLTAQGEQISALTFEVAGKASASLVDALTGTVVQQGDAISINTAAVTSLQGAVAGKADSSVVDQLSQTVQELGGDSLQSQATALRSVTARLQDLELDLAEQEALGLAGDTATRQAIATAYQQLDAYTRLVDGKVETQASRIDGLQVTLAGKVDATALNALRVTVIQQGNSISTNTSAITSLSTTVAGKADVAALNSLTTTVSQQGTAISANADAIGSVAAALPGKADASALNSLTTTVSQQGQDIATNAGAITAANSAIAGKADASAVSTLQTTVTQQGQTISSNTSAITSLQGTVAGKADASALSALSQTVTQQGENISANAGAITTLGSAVAGKADASAVNSLATTVTQQGGTISSQATQLSALATSVGSISADARFRTTVKSQPSGSEATMAMQVRAGDGSAWREAGIYLRAASDGSADVIVAADSFAVTNNGADTVPFAVQNGQVSLALARFQQLTSFNGKLVIDGVAGTISIYD